MTVFGDIAHELAHEAKALERVLQQDRGRPLIEGAAALAGARIQALEDVAWDLLTKRYLDSAEGVQLDDLGRILMCARAAVATDDEYRLILAGRIQVLRSCGSIPDMIAVFGAVFPGVAVEVRTRPPAYVSVQMPADYVITAWQAEVLRGFVRAARAAGVHGSCRWQQSADAALFRLDSGPGLDVGLWAGSGV